MGYLYLFRKREIEKGSSASRFTFNPQVLVIPKLKHLNGVLRMQAKLARQPLQREVSLSAPSSCYHRTDTVRTLTPRPSAGARVTRPLPLRRNRFGSRLMSASIPTPMAVPRPPNTRGATM